MSRGELKDWPDCLKRMSLDELDVWLRTFQRNARVWGGKVAKGALKRAREVEKEIALREKPPDESAQ